VLVTLHPFEQLAGIEGEDAVEAERSLFENRLKQDQAE
jgi:hypothetical protein